MIHVSGVGVLGSFVLRELAHRGVFFTWDDDETPFNAWMASTGAILPAAADTIQGRGIHFWAKALIVPAFKLEYGRFIEKVMHVRYTGPTGFGSSAVDAREAYQFNVQEFVVATREKFKSARVDVGSQCRCNAVLRCRGVGETGVLPIVVWGWSRRVKLRQTNTSHEGVRFAFHFANGPKRYYFYPVPGEPEIWLAGSDTILQRAPASMSARAVEGYRAMTAFTLTRFPKGTDIEEAGPLVEGWRPKPRKAQLTTFDADGTERFMVETTPGLFLARPLYKSGVQCGLLAGAWIADEFSKRFR